MNDMRNGAWYAPYVIGHIHFVGLVLTTLFLLSACSDANHEPEKQSHNIIKQDGRILFTLGDRGFNVPEGNFKGGTDQGNCTTMSAR